MQALRIPLNALIMAAEIAAVAAVAWLGLNHPIAFAGLTAAMALVLGSRLESKRLLNELPFYFGPGKGASRLWVAVVGLLEAMFKALLAGVAALFTFSGTDQSRLFWVAMAFGLVVYAGAAILRALAYRLDAMPVRWGFFRLGPPLGLLFSAGLAVMALYGLVPSPTVSDLGWTIVWEMPKTPNVEQVSELFFRLKQAFDDFVVTLLSQLMPEAAARALGIVLSVNVLAGFVAAVYAAVISSAVRAAEARLP
jgi:hypothetical protein